MFDTDICGICRDTLVAKKVLRCNHVFHAECIDMWAEKCNQCPYCRQPVYQFEKVANKFIDMDPENPFFLTDSDELTDDEISSDILSIIAETSSESDELMTIPEEEERNDLTQMVNNDRFGNDIITFITVDWHYVSQHTVLDESLIDLYFRNCLMKRHWNPVTDRILRNIAMFQELSPTIITKYINYFDINILMGHQPVFTRPLDNPDEVFDL